MAELAPRQVPVADYPPACGTGSVLVADYPPAGGTGMCNRVADHPPACGTGSVRNRVACLWDWQRACG